MFAIRILRYYAAGCPITSGVRMRRPGMRRQMCTSLFVMVLAGGVSAEPLLYDPFDYPVGQPPSRLSDADGAEADGWLYINNANTDDPKMTAGSLSYPGLLPSSGNSVAIDGAGVNAASQSQ